MTHVLAYTSPARGHLYPILPTLSALRRTGHKATVVTLADEVSAVRRLDVDARAMAPSIEQITLDDWKAGSPLGALRATLATWLARASREIDDLRRAIDEHRPDVLLVDVNAWGAISAAEASGLPFAVYSPYFLDLDLPGRPPLGLGLAPSAGLVGRLRDRFLRFVLARVLAPSLRGLSALRRERLSLGPVSSLAGLSLAGDALLYLTVEALEHRHGGWPAKVRFVGPGLFEPPSEAAPPERPVALVTCSTEAQGDERLAEVSLEALSGGDLDVVVTTGAVDPSRFSPREGATVVRFAAHGPILSRAEVVVCHGGMGITQKALAAGVPVVVVPFGRDQLDVARHVEAAGAGVRLAKDGLTPERLREAVRVARTKKEGALRIARAIAASGGPDAAAAVLAELTRPRPVDAPAAFAAP